MTPFEIAIQHAPRLRRGSFRAIAQLSGDCQNRIRFSAGARGTRVKRHLADPDLALHIAETISAGERAGFMILLSALSRSTWIFGMNACHAGSWQAADDATHAHRDWDTPIYNNLVQRADLRNEVTDKVAEVALLQLYALFLYYF